MFLYIVYTIILIYITVILIIEFFKEKRWKMQLAMAFVLLVFVMRILQIK